MLFYIHQTIISNTNTMIRLQHLSLALSMLLLLTVNTTSFARRAPRGEKPPKALLVELLTREPQVKYVKQYRPERLQEIMKDIHSVMRVTTMDFKENFDYMPVYYFIDSNADKIKKGEFAGVLLDENLQPVEQTILAEGDTSFFIAYYSTCIPQPDYVDIDKAYSNRLSAQQESFGDAPLGMKRTLLVMDHRFEMLRLPKPRSPRTYVRLSLKDNRRLTYRSKNTMIDYVPQAASYHATLERYYRPRSRY